MGRRIPHCRISTVLPRLPNVHRSPRTDQWVAKPRLPLDIRARGVRRPPDSEPDGPWCRTNQPMRSLYFESFTGASVCQLSTRKKCRRHSSLEQRMPGSVDVFTQSYLRVNKNRCRSDQGAHHPNLITFKRHTRRNLNKNCHTFLPSLWVSFTSPI